MKKHVLFGVAMTLAAVTAMGSTVYAEDGGSKKIAVLRNMTSSDHTTQFFAVRLMKVKSWATQWTPS